jgi:hypothetical protein
MRLLVMKVPFFLFPAMFQIQIPIAEVSQLLSDLRKHKHTKKDPPSLGHLPDSFISKLLEHEGNKISPLFKLLLFETILLSVKHDYSRYQSLVVCEVGITVRQMIYQMFS